jgi:hypothetical protein
VVTHNAPRRCVCHLQHSQLPHGSGTKPDESPVSSATSGQTSSRCRSASVQSATTAISRNRRGARRRLVMAPRGMCGHQFGNGILSRFPINGHGTRPSSGRALGAQRTAQDINLSGRLRTSTVPPRVAVLERPSGRRLATIVSDRRDRSKGGSSAISTDAGADHGLLSAKLKREPSRSPQAASDGPGPLSVPPPQSHLLRGRVIAVELFRTRLSLVASDHLPLIADVRIG